MFACAKRKQQSRFDSYSVWNSVLIISHIPMGTKMVVAFANIFMARIERQILSQSCIKLLF